MDLLNYIHQARKSGMSNEQIRQGLLQAGWPANDVNEALMNVPVTVVPKPKPKAMMSKSLAIIFIVITLAVGGYFAGAYYMSNYQDLPLWPFDVSVPVPTVTPSPSPVATLDPALDWKTYTNTEYGFEFKYPGDIYDVKSDPSNAKEDTDRFYVIKRTENITPDIAIYIGSNYEDELRGGLAFEIYDFEKDCKSVMFPPNNPAYECSFSQIPTGDQAKSTRIVFKKGNTLFDVSLYIAKEFPVSQILSTFKFTE